MSGMNLNLLPSKAKFQAAKIKLKEKVRTIMFVIGGVWLVTVVVLMAVNLIVKVKIDQVKATSKKVSDNYMAMQDSIVSNQRFKYKTKMVGEVLSKRFEYGKAFENVVTMFPGGVVVKNYDLREDGTFEIRAETQGKDNVDALEKVVLEINGGNNPSFKKANIKSLMIKGGVWMVTMEVVLK